MVVVLWFKVQFEIMVGVIGIFGKILVVIFICQIWQVLGYKVISFGMMGVQGDYEVKFVYIMFDFLILYCVLFEVVVVGVIYVVMEVLLYGLDQWWLDGVLLKVVVFINFSQDYLDYYKNFDEYFVVKVFLFMYIFDEGDMVVINIDDLCGVQMVQIVWECGLLLIIIGKDNSVDLCIFGQCYDLIGQDLCFSYQGQVYLVWLVLIGGFQVENVLVVVGLVIVVGDDFVCVIEMLFGLIIVCGCMELVVVCENGVVVFVDYSYKFGVLVLVL